MVRSRSLAVNKDKEKCYDYFEKAIALPGDNYKAYICYAIAKSDFKDYEDAAELYKKVEKEERIVPNVKGMEGMDAVALLENLGLKVIVKGVGRVKKQSLTSGQAFNKNQTIIIELS